MVVEVACLNPDDDRLAALGHAIFDRVLDDRLENQRGQAGGLELRRDVDLDVEPVGEARLLDVEVEPLQVDFLGQADVGAGVERQARAEEGR